MHKSTFPKPLPCCTTECESHGLHPSKLSIITSIQNQYAECTVLICHLLAFNCEGTIHCDLQKLGARKCCTNHRPACDRMTESGRPHCMHVSPRKSFAAGREGKCNFAGYTYCRMAKGRLFLWNRTPSPLHSNTGYVCNLPSLTSLMRYFEKIKCSTISLHNDWKRCVKRQKE